jgi:hypothetical protein
MIRNLVRGGAPARPRQGPAPVSAAATQLAAERRATLRTFAYWQRLCAGKSLPQGIAGIDEWTPDELCDALFVVQLRIPAKLSLIVHAGAALERIYGEDPVGRPIGDADEFGELFGDLAHNVAAFGKPIPSSGITRISHGSLARYRGILLPLGDAEGRVVAALGAIGCTPVAEQPFGDG